MKLEFEEERPIFIQIAEGIEDAILSQAFPEEGQIPSITEFSAVSYTHLDVYKRQGQDIERIGKV